MRQTKAPSVPSILVARQKHPSCRCSCTTQAITLDWGLMSSNERMMTTLSCLLAVCHAADPDYDKARRVSTGSAMQHLKLSLAWACSRVLTRTCSRLVPSTLMLRYVATHRLMQ